MKGLWTKNWKKALIWLCGYVSLIAYVIAGGYVVAKSTDKELQKTAKQVFVVTLIFAAIEAVLLILSSIASLGADMGNALAWIRFFVTLAKIGVYAACLLMALFTGEGSARAVAAKEEKLESGAEETPGKNEAEEAPEGTQTEE